MFATSSMSKDIGIFLEIDYCLRAYKKDVWDSNI